MMGPLRARRVREGAAGAGERRWSLAAIERDLHQRTRSRLVPCKVEDPLFGPVLQAGIVPGVPEDPGCVRWPGPKIGAHNGEVLGELLSMTAAEIQNLRDDGVL